MICSRSVCSMWRRAGEKAARFYFPSACPGIRKSLCRCCSSCCLLCMSSCPACCGEQPASGERCYRILWHCLHRMNTKALLDEASDYANEAYYCNVDGEYELALQYIDSAMYCLNRRYYKQHAILYTSLYDADGRQGACGTGLVEPDVQFRISM